MTATVTIPGDEYVEIGAWFQTYANAYGGLSTMPDGSRADVFVSGTLSSLTFMAA